MEVRVNEDEVMSCMAVKFLPDDRPDDPHNPVATNP
jgi:hypothetical protein